MKKLIFPITLLITSILLVPSAPLHTEIIKIYNQYNRALTSQRLYELPNGKILGTGYDKLYGQPYYFFFNNITQEYTSLTNTQLWKLYCDNKGYELLQSTFTLFCKDTSETKFFQLSQIDMLNYPLEIVDRIELPLQPYSSKFSANDEYQMMVIYGRNDTWDKCNCNPDKNYTHFTVIDTYNNDIYARFDIETPNREVQIAKAIDRNRLIYVVGTKNNQGKMTNNEIYLMDLDTLESNYLPGGNKIGDISSIYVINSTVAFLKAKYSVIVSLTGEFEPVKETTISSSFYQYNSSHLISNTYGLQFNTIGQKSDGSYGLVTTQYFKTPLFQFFGQNSVTKYLFKLDQSVTLMYQNDEWILHQYEMKEDGSFDDIPTTTSATIDGETPWLLANGSVVRFGYQGFSTSDTNNQVLSFRSGRPSASFWQRSSEIFYSIGKNCELKRVNKRQSKVDIFSYNCSKIVYSPGTLIAVIDDEVDSEQLSENSKSPSVVVTDSFHKLYYVTSNSSTFFYNFSNDHYQDGGFDRDQNVINIFDHGFLSKDNGIQHYQFNLTTLKEIGTSKQVAPQVNNLHAYPISDQYYFITSSKDKYWTIKVYDSRTKDFVFTQNVNMNQFGGNIYPYGYDPIHNKQVIDGYVAFQDDNDILQIVSLKSDVQMDIQLEEFDSVDVTMTGVDTFELSTGTKFMSKSIIYRIVDDGSGKVDIEMDKEL